MTITPLFIVFATLVVVAVVVTWRRRRDAERPRQRQGPVPGYSMTHGDEVALDPSDFDFPMPWRTLMLEEFHSPRRARLVVTLEVEPAEGLRTFAHAVAFDFQARSHAHVVVVECKSAEGVPLLKHLYAPDGRGWSGAEPFQRVTSELAS